MTMWKKLNNNYSVSNKGEVRNDDTGYILKGSLNGKGYKRVLLHKKRYFIHRLVATLFISNPNNYPQVNHIDHDKLNNNVCNLEWCNNQYNSEHAYLNGRISGRAILSNENLKDILSNETNSVKELSLLYNVSVQTIYAVKAGRNIKRFIVNL